MGVASSARWQFDLTCPVCGGSARPVAFGRSHVLSTRATAECLVCGVSLLLEVRLAVVKMTPKARKFQADEATDQVLARDRSAPAAGLVDAIVATATRGLGTSA